MYINPSSEEKRLSLKLSKIIQREIDLNDGSIPFSQYMQLVLYHPQYGYYMTNNEKFGKNGDFITAPEISPIFGKTIARALAPILIEIQDSSGEIPKILEFGAGTGVLAKSILLELKILQIKIDCYQIFDISKNLINKQMECLNDMKCYIEWIDQFPTDFIGIVLANEVLDAMPVDIIKKTNQGWYNMHVIKKDSGFLFKVNSPCRLSNLPKSLLEEYIPNGYTTELSLDRNNWIRTLSKNIKIGGILLIDYGFSEREYYHLHRKNGTLMCHYRHLSIQDLFFYPGICDMTSHVNWTEIAYQAIQSNMKLLGYTNQASYLIDAGLIDIVLKLEKLNNSFSSIHLIQQVQKLLLESEMGDLFKVMFLGKEIRFEENELLGFRGRLRIL